MVSSAHLTRGLSWRPFAEEEESEEEGGSLRLPPLAPCKPLPLLCQLPLLLPRLLRMPLALAAQPGGLPQGAKGAACCSWNL